MALIKTIEWKGYTFEYWNIVEKIWQKPNAQTLCRLAVFKDKETRQKGLVNEILELTKRFSFPGDLSTKELYLEIQKSMKMPVVIKAAIAPVYNNETGKLESPGEPPVIEQQEVNFFIDATNDEIPPEVKS